jgi:hypothetical protein
MKTALEIAMDRAEALEPIPAMTDPLGRHWEQPRRQDIEIDRDHAIMTRATFDQLPAYNATSPSGVYPGKMWRRFNGAADLAFLRRGGRPEWCLCWYGPSARGPEWCTTHMRTILLSDGELPQ